ncbi:NUDIX domain-containing protein [Candidatus Saccharibacteria bacterium]|nr:NUDIX domain-containing protein [Candidatus Saccharibacteria bacterium]
MSEKITNASLAFLKKEGETCLGIKQKKIGAGKWNGWGGREEEGDGSIDDTMVRECDEEGRFTPTEYRKVAEVEFLNPSRDRELGRMLVHIYFVTAWDGEPISTVEMKNPTWFRDEEIPYGKMLEADSWWLRKAIGGLTFRAFAKYGENWEFMEEESWIEEVDGF